MRSVRPLRLLPGNQPRARRLKIRRGRVTALAVLLFSAALVAANVAFGASQWGNPEKVSTGTTVRPPVWLASNQRGDLFAIWEVAGGFQSDENSIYAARRGFDGVWHSATEIATGMYTGGSNFAAAVDSGGNCVVAVGKRAPDATLTLWSVHYDGSKDVWGAPEELPGQWRTGERGSPVSLGPASSPSLTVDPGGNFTAVWQVGAYAWGESHVASARYDPLGGWSDSGAVSLPTRSNLYGPQVGAGPNGTAIAVWGQNAQPARISWNRYDPAAGWGTAQWLENLDGFSGPPALGVAPDGSAVAAWPFENDTTPLGIYGANYSAGGAWSSAVPIGPPGAGNAKEAVAGADARGAALVAWVQEEPGGQTIWAARFGPGAGWGAAERVGNEVTHMQNRPRLAVHSSGAASLVWWEDIPGNATGSESAFANRYEPTTGWGVPFLIDTSVNSTGRTPDVCDDRDNWAIVAWTEPDGGGWALWVRGYGPPPSRVVPVLISSEVVAGVAVTALAGAVLFGVALPFARSRKTHGHGEVGAAARAEEEQDRPRLSNRASDPEPTEGPSNELVTGAEEAPGR